MERPSPGSPWSSGCPRLGGGSGGRGGTGLCSGGEGLGREAGLLGCPGGVSFFFLFLGGWRDLMGKAEGRAVGGRYCGTGRRGCCVLACQKLIGPFGLRRGSGWREARRDIWLPISWASLGFLWARDSLSGRPSMDSNLEVRDVGRRVRMNLRLSSLLACLYQSVTMCWTGGGQTSKARLRAYERWRHWARHERASNGCTWSHKLQCLSSI